MFDGRVVAGDVMAVINLGVGIERAVDEHLVFHPAAQLVGVAVEVPGCLANLGGLPVDVGDPAAQGDEVQADAVEFGTDFLVFRDGERFGAFHRESSGGFMEVGWVIIMGSAGLMINLVGGAIFLCPVDIQNHALRSFEIFQTEVFPVGEVECLP